MKRSDFKVGDIVKAINADCYGITNSENHWVGKIISTDEYTNTFSAETISVDKNVYRVNTGEIFFGLENDARLFTKLGSDTQKPSKAKEKNTIILQAVKRGNRIFVQYRGKCIGFSACDDNDEFDEEFGLNLALQRTCRKLKNTHEITTTESVEDYL